MWRESCSSHQRPLSPHPVLGKQLFFTRFIEYPELERTPKDHCVQLLALHRRPPNNPTLCLSVVQTLPKLLQSSGHLILHKTRDPQLHIPGKLPLCWLGRTCPVFLLQGCSSCHSWLWEWEFWKVPALWITHQEQSHPFQESNFLQLLRKELSSS